MENKKFLLFIALALLAASCNPFSQKLSAGVIKTVNGGVDWQFANSIASSTTASLSSLDISKLAFDPQNRQTLFVGSYTGGMYESQDAAASWKNILSKIDVYDFAVNPVNSQNIYAAGFYGGNGRVLKTMDGGASWNQIYNEESATDPVRSIAINPINTGQLVIGMASGNLIKSSDGGNTWQLVRSFTDQINRVLWQNNNIYVLFKTKGLFVSADLGVSFTEVSASLSKTYNLGSASYSVSPIDSFSQVYVDFTSPALIYLTTDKGLYKTVDGGNTWSNVNLPVQTSTGSARAIAVAQSSSNTVMASVGSTIYKSVDGGSNWQTQGVSTAGFINYILIDPQLPQISYAGVYSTQ